MRIFATRAARYLGVLALTCSTVTAATAQTATAKIVKAANAFLATLDEKERQKALFSFDDEKQRANWSNLPVSFVPRGGISLQEMNPNQRSAAMALVSSALSPKGFEKVQQIMEGDEVNKTTNTGPAPGPNSTQAANNGGGPAPGRSTNRPTPGNGPNAPPLADRPIFGRDLYYISILGRPSEQDNWMLQFGGHHLALNITIAGQRGVLTPTLTGAQPALFVLNGKTVRPLGRESDKALALLNALDENQRKQAILSYRLADLVLGPGQDGKTIQPEGLKGSAMSERQRTVLLDLISEWTAIIHESSAAARMAEMKADVNETWFAWSGPTTADPGKNITAYYRIQGPRLVIEYAPQRLGGDPSMHVHTMYRDPTNDYGRGASAK